MARVCDHKNIVQLHEVFEDANYVYIVMEPCLGARAPAGAWAMMRVCSGSRSQPVAVRGPDSQVLHATQGQKLWAAGSSPPFVSLFCCYGSTVSSREGRRPRAARLGWQAAHSVPSAAARRGTEPGAEPQARARRRRAVRPDRGARAPDGARRGREGARAAGGHPALPLAVRRVPAPAPGVPGARWALGACLGSMFSPRVHRQLRAAALGGTARGRGRARTLRASRLHTRSACAARIHCAASPASSAALPALLRSCQPLAALVSACARRQAAARRVRGRCARPHPSPKPPHPGPAPSGRAAAQGRGAPRPEA